MKKLLQLTKTLLMAVCLGGANFAWADDVVVPTPVYFNDFSFAANGQDGIEIVGNGVFEDDTDARFGKIFHNDPTNTSAVRTNYLKLPSDVLSHSATSKEMTIGFWVNKKSENDFWVMPLFTAYGAAPAESVNTFPMFACQTRGLLQVNCAGWCNFDAADNDKGTNYEGTYWLDDGEWHYYSVVLTETTAKVYVDGNIVNSWTVDNSEAHVISGLFTNGSELTYVCLGGNQSWDWENADPAFGFDDFAVYDVALSKTQIDQIRANKLNRTVTGTRVGNVDNSTDYLAATSSKITLKPGESYHYSFINYNTGGYYTNYSKKQINAWNNWILPVYNSSDENVIAVRLDNWEDKHHVGETWGSNAGCSSDFNWTNFSGNVNGATVDMTVTFTADKKFTMSSTINTVDGSTWSYSYTNDYTDSPIDLTSNDYIKVALSVSRSWLDITSEGYSAVAATISSLGWSTFSSAYPLDFANATPSGLTAYMVTGTSGRDAGSTITPAAVNNVPGNTGLLLNGAENTTYTIPVLASSSTSTTGNLMKPVVTATTVNYNDNNGYNYVLANNNGTPEFQQIVYGTHGSVSIAAGKAYLSLTSPEAPTLFLNFNDITGIGATLMNNERVNSEIYNLAGQRVAQPTKGLYIVNGKKVVIK